MFQTKFLEEQRNNNAAIRAEAMPPNAMPLVCLLYLQTRSQESCQCKMQHLLVSCSHSFSAYCYAMFRCHMSLTFEIPVNHGCLAEVAASAPLAAEPPRQPAGEGGSYRTWLGDAPDGMGNPNLTTAVMLASGSDCKIWSRGFAAGCYDNVGSGPGSGRPVGHLCDSTSVIATSVIARR